MSQIIRRGKVAKIINLQKFSQLTQRTKITGEMER